MVAPTADSSLLTADSILTADGAFALPPGTLSVQSGKVSSDSLYHLRYPTGNAPVAAALASNASVASSVAATLGSSGSNPLSLPLLSASSNAFTYLGSFTVPSAFAYGGSGMSVSNGVMYVSGIQQTAASIGSLRIPTPAQIKAGGAAATTIQAPVSIGSNIGQNASSSNTVLTGSLVHNGNLYVNLGIFYNSANAQTGWISTANTNLSSFGTPCGIAPSAGSAMSMFSCQLGLVPSIWQPILGGPAFVTGGIGLAIVSTLCIGFGFSTFDPSTISSSGGNVVVNELLNYPNQTNTGEDDFGTTALWNRPNVTGSISGSVLTVSSVDIAGTVIKAGATIQWSSTGSSTISSLGTGSGGVGTYNLSSSATVASTGIWISNTAVSPSSGASTGGNDLASAYDGPLGCAIIGPNSRSLLFVNIKHYGPSGTPFSNLNCDAQASGSRDPRRLQITAYDLAALVNNKNSGGSVHAVQPYAWWEMPNWQSLFGSCPGTLGGGSENGCFCFDPVNSILYGCPNGFGGSSLTVYAWSVAGV